MLWGRESSLSRKDLSTVDIPCEYRRSQNIPCKYQQKYKSYKNQIKMLPMWPSINPSLIGSLMNNGATGATNEEQEIRLDLN